MSIWLMVTSEDSFNATAKAGILGFYGSRQGQELIYQTAVGDKIIFYITKKKLLKGVFEVVSEPYLDESRLYGDERDISWNQRIKLRTIEADAQVDMASVVESLSFFNKENKAANFGVYMVRTLRPLTSSDFERITRAMKLKASV